MAEVERFREMVSGSFNQDDLQRRAAEGWMLVAVEWERASIAAPLAPEPMAPAPANDVPFGLKVAGDCAHLEDNPEEREVLLAMMELTIQDGPYSAIAEELNRRGFRTRDRVRWTPISVFQMLPRLIEVGPKIFHSSEWEVRRKQIERLQSR